MLLLIGSCLYTSRGYSRIDYRFIQRANGSTRHKSLHLSPSQHPLFRFELKTGASCFSTLFPGSLFFPFPGVLQRKGRRETLGTRAYLVFWKEQNSDLIRANHQLLATFLQCSPRCLGKICTLKREKEKSKTVKMFAKEAETCVKNDAFVMNLPCHQKPS